MKRIIHQHVTLKRMRVCRLIFNSVSKVIRDCIDFALLRSVIGPENSRHSRNQSDAKTKTDLVTFVFPRFRQFCRLYFEFPLARKGIFLSSHWLLWLLRFWLWDTQSKSVLTSYHKGMPDFVCQTNAMEQLDSRNWLIWGSRLYFQFLILCFCVSQG